MNYILLGLIAFLVALQNVLKKKYTQKAASGVVFFSAIISFFAMLFFMAVNRDWSYRAELLLPSLGFALSFAAGSVFSVLAIRYGSLAKTSLILSFSLLIPSFYGMIFLNEPVGPALIVGTVLLAIALVLTNYEPDREESGEGKSLWKWVVCVTLSFIGNGMCSTVQKIEGLRYGDEGKNMFMIVALAMVTVIVLIASLCMREERQNMKEALRCGWLLGSVAGIVNGLTNFLVIYLNGRSMPASVLFPVVSGGSMVLIFLYAVLVQRERFNRRQLLGFLLGVISIVLLNL